MKLLTILYMLLAIAVAAPENAVECGKNGVTCFDKPNEGVKKPEKCGTYKRKSSCTPADTFH